MQTAAVVRKRCFNRCKKQTSYLKLTGRRTNLFKMQKSGSVCYAYRQNKRKLDSRCEKGIFVGYDKNSPEYMVCYPNSGQVQKHWLMKFETKTRAERQTQPDIMPDDDIDFEIQCQCLVQFFTCMKQIELPRSTPVLHFLPLHRTKSQIYTHVLNVFPEASYIQTTDLDATICLVDVRTENPRR